MLKRSVNCWTYDCVGSIAPDSHRLTATSDDTSDRTKCDLNLPDSPTPVGLHVLLLLNRSWFVNIALGSCKPFVRKRTVRPVHDEELSSKPRLMPAPAPAFSKHVPPYRMTSAVPVRFFRRARLITPTQLIISDPRLLSRRVLLDHSHRVRGQRFAQSYGSVKVKSVGELTRYPISLSDHHAIL